MAKRDGLAKKVSQPGRLRIVAGKWRSRLLPIANQRGLRPTSARVRETLFNWLSTEILGSHCLDPFAGTGALGFEALSRGAATVTMIEKSPKVADILRNSAALLEADNVRIECADAMSLLKRRADKRYDIVFLDPPFADDLVEECCHLLQSNGWLADRAAIYIEQDKSRPLTELPAGWQVTKNKKAGNVRFSLAHVNEQDQQGETR
jgi:16S rRNA (guanine966-N2)-methyltransferase